MPTIIETRKTLSAVFCEGISAMLCSFVITKLYHEVLDTQRVSAVNYRCMTRLDTF